MGTGEKLLRRGSEDKTDNKNSKKRKKEKKKERKKNKKSEIFKPLLGELLLKTKKDMSCDN